MSRSIPVLTYHMVRPAGPVTPDMFEHHLQWLARSGYRTIDSEELYQHLTEKKVIAGPAVQITFDDGWLDNWIYAYPLLKKYGLKATIFVITDRIQNQKQPERANLEDIWHRRAAEADLPQLKSPQEIFFDGIKAGGRWDDFLSWSEIKTMVQSGHIEIQSHSHTHAYHFTGSKVIDFNRLRHWKIAWATAGDFRLGIPEYEGASSLTAPRYYDSEKIRDLLAAEAMRVGASEWLKQKNAKRKFQRAFRLFYDSIDDTLKKMGTYENEQVFRERGLTELQLSRKLIATHTATECSFLCWPWGEYSPDSLSMARQAGFSGTYTLDRGSNKPGDPAETIRRFEIRPNNMLWFASRILLYSHPLLASVYYKLHHRF
ncbi:polysaccharide deacetylase family protein [candidate division CSSED10-310 bacterium]|uniref:Polysaccharide deacetylase family protein n=1 Tax=candidate division CSSED10-310 bacterium TaxID=2855610 RepID=A0ABV6YV31_UNCC1